MKTIYIVPERVSNPQPEKKTFNKSKLVASALILGLAIGVLEPATLGMADNTPAPDMSVTKTVDNTTPKEGDNITYTITATNVGSELATGVVVNDTLPGDLTFVSANATKGNFDSSSGIWTIGSLAAGDCGVLTITAKVNNGTSQKTITNTARVTMAETDSTPADNTASISITVKNSDSPLSCTVEKDTVEKNETVKYTANGGNGEYSWSAPTGEPYSGIGSVFSTKYDLGGPKVVTVKSNGQTANCGLTVTGVQPIDCDSNPALCKYTPPVFVPQEITPSALTITKTTNTYYPKEGETVEFSITVTNKNGSPVNAISVNDNLPAGLNFSSVVVSKGSYTGSWYIRTLDDGESATMKLSAKVASGTMGKTITNTASIVSPQTQGDNSASVTIQVVERCSPATCGGNPPAPTPNPPREPRPANPTIVCSASPSSITAGQTVTFSATAGFNSYSWTVNGGSKTSSDQQSFTSKFDQVGTYTATVSTSDINPAISGSCTVTVTAPTGPGPVCTNLNFNATNSSVSKTNLKPSESFSVTCDYGNGTADSINASINNSNCTFTAFAGTKANFNCLAPSAIGNYDVVCKVLAGTASNTCAQTNKLATVTVANPSTSSIACAANPASITAGGTTTFSATPSTGSLSWTVTGGSVTATSSVASFVSKFDQAGTFTATVTNEQGKTATCSVTVTSSGNGGGGGNPPAAPDVKVTKTVNKATANEGDTVQFTIVASNNGGSVANAVVVNDTLPVGLTLTATSTTVGTYDVSTNKWTIGSLDKDASATLTISAKINSGTAGTTITNTATVAMQQTDSTPADNTASASVTVNTPSSGGGSGGGSGGSSGGSGVPAPQSTSSGGSGIPIPPGQVLGSFTGLQMPFVGLQMPDNFVPSRPQVQGITKKIVLPRTGAPIAALALLELSVIGLLVLRLRRWKIKKVTITETSVTYSEPLIFQPKTAPWIMRMQELGIAIKYQ